MSTERDTKVALNGIADKLISLKKLSETTLLPFHSRINDQITTIVEAQPYLNSELTNLANIIHQKSQPNSNYANAEYARLLINQNEKFQVLNNSNTKFAPQKNDDIDSVLDNVSLSSQQSKG